MMNKSGHRTSSLASVLLVVLVVTLLAATGCGEDKETTTTSSIETTAAGSATDTPYTIALLTTMSGAIGFLGEDISATAQMECDLINANGGINGHPLRLVIEDDGMDSSKASAALTKLVENPDVLAVCGGIMSSLVPALQPIAERNQIPMVFCCNSLPQTRAQSPQYTYHIGQDEVVAASGMLDICEAKGFSNLVLITSNDPSCIAVVDEFQKQATAAGITCSRVAAMVELNTIDVTPQVNEMKTLVDSVGADGIASTVWANMTATLMKTMKTSGVNLPVVAYNPIGDWSILSMGGDELNGLLCPCPKVLAAGSLPDTDPQKAVVNDFCARYEAKFGHVPGAVASLVPDMIWTISEALKVSGPDRVKLRDAIAATTDLVGTNAVRTISLPDNSGAQPGCFIAMEIVDMQWQLME